MVFRSYLLTILFSNIFTALTWNIITNLSFDGVTLLSGNDLTFLFRNLFTLRPLYLKRSIIHITNQNIIKPRNFVVFKPLKCLEGFKTYRRADLSWHILALFPFNWYALFCGNPSTFLFGNVVTLFSWDLGHNKTM